MKNKNLLMLPNTYRVMRYKNWAINWNRGWSRVWTCSIFLFSSLLFQFNAEAQVTQGQTKLPQESMNKIIDWAKMNGFLVGAAVYCEFPDDDIRRLHQWVSGFVDQIQLPEEEKKLVAERYNDAVKEGKTKGPAIKDTTCRLYQPEFDKISQALQRRDVLPRIAPEPR